MVEESSDGGTAPEAQRVVLQPKLDLRESEKLAAEIQTHRGQDLTVDANEVEQLGAHALQTLLVAAESWRSDGRTFAVIDFSEAAIGQLAVMGFDAATFDGERTTQ